MADNHDPAPTTATAFAHVPDHELVRLVGRGSYGEVWLARNTLGAYRAIKIVYENTFRHKRPFEREFNGVQKFEPISRLHEGLMDVLQVGRNEAAGYFYCVMELADDIVSGQAIDPEKYSPRTLAQEVAKHKRLRIGECHRVGLAIASALDFLHGRGLIHRDVKPSNIVFVNGVPKLADIGLVAEMSEARSYVGTEGFIPPEGPGTVQADIYSLGKVLYEISTGKDRHEYPDLPSVTGDGGEEEQLFQLNRVIVKACRNDPRERYRTARMMADDLRELGCGGRDLQGFFRRAFWPSAAVVLGLVLAAAGWRFAGRTSAFEGEAYKNFSPAAGAIGTEVSIAGTNFSPTPSDNVVHFGAVRARVMSATPTNLLLTVPVGATYAPITVTTKGFVSYSSASFLPVFAGLAADLEPEDFAPRFDLVCPGAPVRVVVGDFDGDGKPDLAVAALRTNRVLVFRNVAMQGPLRHDSLVPAAELPIRSGNHNPYNLTAADVDGDGWIDVAVSDRIIDRVVVFRNTSSGGSPGSVSFAAPVEFVAGADPRMTVVRDLDGDGRPDMAVANHGTSTIRIFRNIGQAGTLETNSFAAPVEFRLGPNTPDIIAEDLDRDGRPDLAVANAHGTFISVFRNRSVAGVLDTNSFEERIDLPAPYTGLCLAAADLDGDERVDLILGSWKGGQKLSIYQNRSSPGQLSARSFGSRLDFSVDGSIHRIAVADMDGDAKPDLTFTTEEPDRLSVFPNRSVPGVLTANSLGPRVDLPAVWNPSGLAVVDLDGDGRPDIVSANVYGEALSIFQNFRRLKAD